MCTNKAPGRPLAPPPLFRACSILRLGHDAAREGLGSRVWGWGLGFGVQGSESRVWSSRVRVQGSEFGVEGLGIRVQASGFMVQGLAFRVGG